MKIKRYVAPDMRRAMRQVRDKQGPDAVILSSKRIDGGIEVIAAIDYDARLLDQSNRPGPAENPRQLTQDPAPSGRTTDTWSNDPTLIGMKQEVASLRKLLESQLASLTWSDSIRRNPVCSAVIRELITLGLSPPLAQSLAEQSGHTDVETAVANSLELLKQRLPILDREIFDNPGAVALVGPTGVGKTTTIAKLAARFVLKHGADSLGLLTTDTFRIGAQEQLMTFGRILGVPVELVRDSEQLCATIRLMADKRLILIDSAGMSQRDQRIHSELASISQSGANARVLLTLSSNAQPIVLEETIQAFSYLNPIGCVLTKTDETASLGGAISALVRHGLPLAYVTDGQRVPEDMRWAGGKRFNLVERAVELKNSESLRDFDEVLAHG